MKAKHKIVCWGDYAIPVPLDVNWLAMDKRGDWYVYQTEPHVEPRYSGSVTQWYGGDDMDLFADRKIELTPPEPGPWTEQLYWIGD